MFENVLGHKDILEKLKTTVEKDTPSHAYVFYGKEGVGKSSVAKEFAKAVLKTNNLDGNIDFKCVERMPDKQNILVEQIRDEVISDVYIAPATSKYKVYVIDEADKMNDSSQNALLKTLEEPPKSVIIILVTSNIDGLLGTILSRTTNIYFEPLDESEIKKYTALNKIEVSEELVQFAEGSISTLLKVADESNKQILGNLSNIIQDIKAKDKVSAINLLKDVSLKDELTFKYIEYLMLKNAMYGALPLLEDARKAVNSNANEDMQKMKLAIKLCEWGEFIGTKSIMCKISIYGKALLFKP